MELISLYQNADVGLFWFFYNLSHHYAWLDAVGIFFAEYASYVVAVILAVALIWPRRELVKRRAMILVSVTAAFIARYVVKAAIVLAYPRPRPCIVFSSVQPLVSVAQWENWQSFPSGHTIFFFALATTLFCFNKKVGLWMFVLAIVVGVARIFVGVHWPSDVDAGAILGILTGWLVYRLYRAHASAIDRGISRVFALMHFEAL